MALTVKDIIQLEGLRNMKPIAGLGGLNRQVVTIGIADHEFASFADPSERDVFEPNSIVLTSLLFAKDEPEQILSAVEYFYQTSAAAFAYKVSVFDELPQEVMDFANDHDFPILKYKDLFMDVIIFEVLEAVRAEDDNFFSEDNINQIVANNMTKTQVYALSKNISLKFKDYAMAIYIKDDTGKFQINLERYAKMFYLNGALSQKSMVCKYKDGMFAILTAKQNKKEIFNLILSELMDFLSLNDKNLHICKSKIHDPFEDLDQCIRESYYTYIASLAEEKNFDEYNDIGEYQILIPLADTRTMNDYMNSIIEPLKEKQDFLETIKQYTLNEGDIFNTAASLSCHHNTIRYRISKIKQFLFGKEMTDQVFYANVSLAMRLLLIHEHK